MGRVKCEICEEEMRVSEDMPMLSKCEHRYKFCESCLHHYAIYKINNFEEVFCPHEGCQALLDTDSKFFNQLPSEVQNRYPKVHRFHIAQKDPNTNLCPHEDCEGLVRQQGEKM